MRNRISSFEMDDSCGIGWKRKDRDDSLREAWLEGDEGGEIEHQQWTRFYFFLASK